MPAPISMDLRLRIVGAVEHGSSIREEKAAALAMVCGPPCQGEVMPAPRPAPACCASLAPGLSCCYTRVLHTGRR
jgi:hypothetical protein